MNGPILVLTIWARDKAKETEDNDEKNDKVHKALEVFAPGLPTVSETGRTSTTVTKPPSVESFTDQSKDLLCRQLTSTIGTTGSDYSYYRNGFLIQVAAIDGDIQKFVPRSLQARLSHTIPTSD